jgi:hypothetical protein
VWGDTKVSPSSAGGAVSCERGEVASDFDVLQLPSEDRGMMEWLSVGVRRRIMIEVAHEHDRPSLRATPAYNE